MVFDLLSCPTYAFRTDFGSILWATFCPCNKIHTGVPNSRKCVISGRSPCHAWYGVEPCKDVVKDLLRMYAACSTAGSQRNLGRSAAVNIAWASSMSVLFIHSATPFCEGEYSAVHWTSMPCVLHQVIRSWFTNSVPQSIWMA